MSFTYRGLQTTLERHIVTEEEVQQHIQRLIAENPRVEVITDRAAQLGDEVILDYAGFCDGEQFAGGTAEKQSLTLGSGMFIPGFEEQLVGAAIGEEVSVLVTFPTEYHAPNLAGKAAEFKCKIHEIRLSTPHQADDTFAKEFAKCDTLQEFHDKLATSMQDFADYRGEMDLQDRLLKMAVETFEFTPDDAQVEREMDEQMDIMRTQLAQQGLDMAMYCRFMNTTEAQIREDNRANAVSNLRTQAAIEQIVVLENLVAEEEEINQAVALVARQNNMTLEQLKPYYNAEFESQIISHVVTSKVMKLIRDNAVITEI